MAEKLTLVPCCIAVNLTSPLSPNSDETALPCLYHHFALPFDFTYLQPATSTGFLAGAAKTSLFRFLVGCCAVALANVFLLCVSRPAYLLSALLFLRAELLLHHRHGAGGKLAPFPDRRTEGMPRAFCLPRFRSTILQIALLGETEGTTSSLLYLQWVSLLAIWDSCWPQAHCLPFSSLGQDWALGGWMSGVEEMSHFHSHWPKRLYCMPALLV